MLFSLLSSAHTRVGQERPVMLSLSCVCVFLCVRMRCASNYMVGKKKHIHRSGGHSFACPGPGSPLDTGGGRATTQKNAGIIIIKEKKTQKFPIFFFKFSTEREGSVVVKPREFKK